MREVRHRLFFALWPDEEAAEHLHAVSHDLVAHARVPGRISPQRNLHMTVAFVGSVDSALLDRLAAAAGDLELTECEVTLDHFGFWPRGGVVYAGCRVDAGAAGTPLRRIFAACAELLDDLDVPHEHRTPVPHVTLARNVRGIDLPRLGEPVSWLAQELTLVRSELRPAGARYETIASWSLHSHDD